MILIRRRDAAQATLNSFLHKPFEWGKNDCAQLVAFNLMMLTDHDPAEVFGAYDSFKGAKRALQAQGVSTLPAYLDAQGYSRIPPAMAVDGDIIGFEDDDGERGLGTLGVHVGSNRVLMFLQVEGHEDVAPTCGVVKIAAANAAWRAV